MIGRRRCCLTAGCFQQVEECLREEERFREGEQIQTILMRRFTRHHIYSEARARRLQQPLLT